MEGAPMIATEVLEAFPGCPALDGYHCVTSSLAKIYHYAGHPLSEEMLLGLGAGMGFIYWRMKLPGAPDYVFIGGRGNGRDFFTDLGARTGVKISTTLTSSPAKAEAALLAALARHEPVMVNVDMGLLPYFDLPPDYHFGGHTVTIGGFDGSDTVLVADMDQRAPGLKKGFYAPVSLEQLRQARSSPHKPFPPNNAAMVFDFGGFRPPTADDVNAAIRQTAEAHLNPPIKNIGVKGMRHAAKELRRWPDSLPDRELRLNLFNLYVFIEIGGTGGGCFRYMYARFLREAADITRNPGLLAESEKLEQSGRLFSEIGALFRDAEALIDGREDPDSLRHKIAVASAKFEQIAGLEEAAHARLLAETR
jgi:hypothetical protein